MTQNAKGQAKAKLDAFGIDEVCSLIGDCKTLQVIADQIGVAKSRLIVWLLDYPDQYARAKEMQADKMVDDILSIADDGRNDTYVDEKGNRVVDQDVIARSRLRIEARKWLAGKMRPKVYGEKTVIAGDPENPLMVRAAQMSDEQLAKIASSGSA